MNIPTAKPSRQIRVKICGLMQAEQVKAIAHSGADALGFICVPESPRFLEPAAIQAIVRTLPTLTSQGHPLAKIGVFANAALEDIISAVEIAALTGVQLHGQESPAFCRLLRQALPSLELIKAFRVKNKETLLAVADYSDTVDSLLLDAYAKNALGGTGESWDWSLVQDFDPGLPWLLAGGLTPINVNTALQQARPSGIDLSSGVERSPGDKDMKLIQQLLDHVARR
jgi:phosphoribosylanthranilate isomerase